MSTEGNRNHTRQMGREFKALNYNLFSFKKGIRLEHKPEMCLPSILNIPTTKNKSSRYVTFYFIVFIFPSCSGVPSSLDTAGPSLPEDIPGAKKNTSKEPFFFFHLECSRLYQVSDIFKTFPKGQYSYKFFTHTLNFPHSQYCVTHRPAGVTTGIRVKICTGCKLDKAPSAFQDYAQEKRKQAVFKYINL